MKTLARSRGMIAAMLPYRLAALGATLVAVVGLSFTTVSQDTALQPSDTLEAAGPRLVIPNVPTITEVPPSNTVAIDDRSYRTSGDTADDQATAGSATDVGTLPRNTPSGTNGATSQPSAPTTVPPTTAARTPAQSLLPVDPALPPVPNLSSPLNGVTGLLGLNPSGTPTLNATFTLRGNGITATVKVANKKVTATATGLDPTKRYISLYYGSMSTAVPGQTFTCADARTAALPYQWGIQPEWVVNADGTGTLNGTAPRNLMDVFTMSIRSVPPTALADPYMLFNPVLYPVVACGATR